MLGTGFWVLGAGFWVLGVGEFRGGFLGAMGGLRAARLQKV